MNRTDTMAARLPPLYREGELVAGVLSPPALQLEILAECLLEIQRAHFFDAALELEDAGRLAAVLDILPEPWQNLALFRAWVHAQRDAVLGHGAVTAAAIVQFVESFTAGFQDALQLRFSGGRFPGGRPVLTENPRIRREDRPQMADNITPLARFTLNNQGLDPAPASFLFTGLPGGPESLPVIVNLTTGEGLLFLGNIGPGQRLWLRTRDDGTVEGRLEHRDVSDQLRSIANVVPGEAWSPPQVTQPARSITLERGSNDLWFLPVAHYDALGLDRFLLALADLALSQGRWDEARLDHSVFYQDAAVMLTASWVESEPASIEVRVPAQCLLRRPLAPGTPENTREQLGQSVDLGVRRLKAAGVRSKVQLVSFSETQPQMDFLTAVLPLHLREVGSTGVDRMPDLGGQFDVTGYGDSTYR